MNESFKSRLENIGVDVVAETSEEALKPWEKYPHVAAEKSSGVLVFALLMGVVACAGAGAVAVFGMPDIGFATAQAAPEVGSAVTVSHGMPQGIKIEAASQ